MKNLIFLLIVVSIIGCKSTEPIYVPVHDSTTSELIERITEDPTWTDPESLLYQFAFECDSNYNVLLKRLNEVNSGLEASIQVKEKIIYRSDNTKVNRLLVDVSVLVDSLEVQNRTIERLKKSVKIQQVPYPVPGPEVRYIPKYHKITALAAPLMLLLILFALYRRIKGKKIIPFL